MPRDLDFIKYIFSKSSINTWRIIKRLLFCGKLGDFLNKILLIAFDKCDLNCIKIVLKSGIVLSQNINIDRLIRKSSIKIMEYFAMPREIHVMRDMKIVTANIQIYNFDKNIMAIKCRDGDIEFVRRHPQVI